MSRRLSFLHKICQRTFALNSPCTSSTAPYLDYSLSNEIIKESLPEVDFHCHNFISNLNEDLQKIHLIEKKINSVRYDVRKCFSNPDIRLVPIGSAANRLINNSSDLDLVLLPSNNLKEWRNFMKKFSTSEPFRSSYMKKVHEQLVAGHIGIVKNPFFHARIPIIRCLSKKRLQVDIQFGNIGPIRSSLFVRTCVEYDERVPLLIHWLTNKFQETGILNSYRRLFSRYHVNVLVVHFLQAIPYPVLPDVIKLSPWLRIDNDWNNAVKVLTRQGSLYVPSCSETPNEQSVGSLAVQLIDYYSQIDFKRFAIDTRGRIIQRTDNDPLQLKIVDEYFEHSTCCVVEAPRLIYPYCMLILRRLFSRMSVLHPPEAVRGMTKLEKEAFRVPVDFPVIEIEARDSGLVNRRVRLEPFLIGHKLKPLKNLMESENGGKKYLVFHPDKVHDEETRQKIVEMIKRELGEDKSFDWTTLSKDLTFDNWDTKSIFKAVLPEGIEYSSYTQTGHIIHCNFVDEILPFRHVIAEVLLNKVNNCKTVVQKGNIITNVYRNLDLELLAGEENYVTEVKETGLRFMMDFSKVYWNSRLSHEHERVSGLFNNQSLVYDACCGIGPFVLPAKLKKKPRRVLANDLNPESVKWLKENVRLNKIKEDQIEIHNMDAKLFIKQKIAADVIRLMNEESTSEDSDVEQNKPKTEIHVVMNLPAYAINFLPSFRGVLRQYSSEIDKIPQEKRWKWNVYCYLFAKSHVDVPDSWYEEEARRMCDEKTKWERSIVVKCHNVRTVSSRKEMFCAQLELPYEFLLAEPLPDEPEASIEPEETDEPCSKKAKTDN